MVEMKKMEKMKMKEEMMVSGVIWLRGCYGMV